MLRISGGKHRNRRLEPPEDLSVRPTAERARLAIFNRLAHGLLASDGAGLDGIRVVDVFAGSGALGFEALSRGAAHITFIEKDRGAAKRIERNAAALGETAHVQVLQRDGIKPGPALGPCELAFLDPPYRSGLSEAALRALAADGWLAQGAICVVETASTEDVTVPPGFIEIDQRKYGAGKITMLRWES